MTNLKHYGIRWNDHNNGRGVVSQATDAGEHASARAARAFFKALIDPKSKILEVYEAVPHGPMIEPSYDPGFRP